ncbi:MAG: hypothetical protein RBU30_25575, partial [Polyangia bacterium]|nr:hypothetical protein [Polyangia bacterium]
EREEREARRHRRMGRYSRPERARPCRGWGCNLRVQLGLEGFYSADMTFIRDLANLKGSVLPNTSLLREPLTKTSYFTHHLRMEPNLSVGKLATLYLRMDGVQHVVWGDNDARAQSSLFAGSPTNTSDYGEQVASFQLVWAWLDLDLKLGKLRVGRMPSHWGMGLLSNGGGDLAQTRGGVDDDFADNRHPSIYDRILFATKPLQVIKTIAKAKDPTSNLLVAYAYDRLVEEPYWKDISLEGQRAYGESAFLSRQLNNVDEHVLVIAYSDPKFLSQVRSLDAWKDKSLTAGVYAVYRRQGRLDRILRYNVDGSSTYAAYDCEGANPPPACGARSKIGIVDPYLRLRLGPILLETESYFIFGKTEPGRGIPIGSEVGKALIYGWVTRAGYSPMKKMELLLDLGQASGDKVYGNEVFRQRAMHPDYVPGLILYRMFLRERSATALAQSLNSNVAGVPTPSRGLQSNGGVLNSYFLYPRMLWAIHPMLTLKVALLSAWSHRPEQYLYRVTGCEKGVKGASCRLTDNHIGTEVDVGVDVRWGGVPGIEHLFFRFDMGYLVFGKQVASDYDAPGVFALRMRLMFVF